MLKHPNAINHKQLIFLFLFIVGTLNINAQCPSISNVTQSFCDIDGPIISDLIATDNGNGVFWYDTQTSTTPISASEGLISGEDYYADDATGTCGTRERVDVFIYGAPLGLNFQGVCVDDANDATISDLNAIGNNVQWYSVSSGGIALLPTTILNDNTIYYADQENPDTNCRTSRLSVLVNVGVVPVPTGDAVQEFCSDDAPTVADLVALGFNNWYPNSESVVPLDQNVALIDGENYFATSVDPPCESDNRLEVTVVINSPANSGTDGVLDFCETDLSTIMSVDLIDSLSGNPDIDGFWSGPFPTTNGSTGTLDITSLTVAGGPYIFTYQVDTTTVCGSNTSTVTITINPLSDPGTDGAVDLCLDNGPVDLFTILGGSPETGGTWTPALASGTGVFDPTLDTAGVYTYTISGSAPCPDASATVTVTTNIPPDPGTGATLDLCTNSDPIDLFTVLGGSPETGGSWSPALASGTGLFDPAIDPAGAYTYTLTGTPPCGDQSATVNVTFIPSPDAGTDGAVDLCLDNGPIDLFTLLGGSPETGGSWTPALASGTGVFDPSLDTAGVYTYTISGSAPCSDASATVTVTTNIPPDPGTGATVDLCTNSDPIDLFTVLGGSPETGGSWSPALASGTGLFDPALDAAGAYTYTLTGTPPCGDQSATVNVTFIPSPDAGTDGAVDLCLDNGPIDLFTLLGGSPETGGTWSPALASGTGVFDPSLDTAGVYTYTIPADPPCENSSATVTVTTNIPPDPGTGATVDLCTNSDPIDLFTVLGGSPETGGSWSPALASGTGLFDPALDAAGAYTYTLTGTPPCGDQSATVNVTFIPSPDAGTDGAVDLCLDNGPIDLFTLLGGSPETGGTWSPALASGTGVFDPSLDTAGAYTYTIPADPPCEDSSATVTVTTNIPPDPGTGATVDLCTNSDPIDLFTVLGGSPEIGGSWSPALASGTGLFDPAIDPAGAYTYTLTGTPPCGDQSATVNVTFIPSPDAGTDGAVDLCLDNGPIDLFTILGGSPETGGTWSPALASGTGVFDPSLDADGVYTYTIPADPPCEDSSATVTVTTSIPPDPGTGATLDLCNNGGAIDLFTILGGSPETGGTWSPALSSGTGLFDPNDDIAGVYTYTLTGTSPCEDQSATVTVSIIPPPNAGEDSNAVICIGDGPQDLFNYLNGTPDSGGTWSPTLVSGSGIFDPNVDPAGIYTYTVTGPIACNQSDTSSLTVTIETNPDATGLEMSSEDICLGLSNDISITNATFLADGTFTLTYNLSGANISNNTTTINVLNGDSVFNIPASLLTNTGLTTVTITSITNVGSICSADVSAILPSSFTVLNSVTPELIENGNIFCLQDEPTIENLSSSIISTEVITWYDAPTNGNSYENTETLIDGQTYYASALSDDGCESTVRLEVTVTFENCPVDIVIPDGFSPNDDSINDEFTIENLRELYPNFTLEIYNRYGNILYKGDITTPDWDGTSDKGVTLGDSRLPVGIYFFILEFNDGNRNPIQGRVYLSR
ncbi:gliding motility-associated C-terminal domain-containing protein [Psychroserpens sp. Hel_I_66]|uniref:gliding motility-associated C-terminal domain-containing protein n=1 Tax=Psychroserpens sp. Hel_I_66 TaxID=1250004 RepID=UPI000645E516|nr:T9SS C-terminal target domain-containing protein [Psychroserpens sp. Hel_I_66]